MYLPYNTVKMEAFFEEVSFQDLQVGVKYKIKSMPHHYTYYTGVFKQYNGTLQVFEKVMFRLELTNILKNNFVYKFYYGFTKGKNTTGNGETY